MFKHFLIITLFFLVTSLKAQYTLIPDPIFEQELIIQGIDKSGNLDGKVLTFDITYITTLDVDKKNISDLTGIEDFRNLENLYCYGNNIASLDLSQNSNLEFLDCSHNQLADLNVTGASDLEVLKCSSNELTTVDISENPSLIYLHCSSTLISILDISKNINLENLFCGWTVNLTSLDVSKNIALKFLSCENSALTNLDLSQNKSLTGLSCDKNKLTELDLSQNSALTGLTCNSNQLVSLNVKNGNSSLITLLDATDNSELNCIEVDYAEAANLGIGNYGKWEKDDIATYSEDCQAFLGVDDELLSQGLKMYPNPSSNRLSIQSKLPLEKVEVYSILGQKILEVNDDFEFIDLRGISSGLYLLKMSSLESTATRKLIKY